MTSVRLKEAFWFLTIICTFDSFLIFLTVFLCLHIVVVTSANRHWKVNVLLSFMLFDASLSVKSFFISAHFINILILQSWSITLTQKFSSHLCSPVWMSFFLCTLRAFPLTHLWMRSPCWTEVLFWSPSLHFDAFRTLYWGIKRNTD